MPVPATVASSAPCAVAAAIGALTAILAECSIEVEKSAPEPASTTASTAEPESPVSPVSEEVRPAV